ncbi:MAG: pyridoxal-phosphate dependent enzyme [Bacteroidia bacterium]
MKPEELYHWCHQFCLSDILKESRIHKLSVFGDNFWIKREDESGFLGGTKSRKYASLLAYARKHNIETLAIVGGANSNHVPALMALAKQQGFKTELWLRKPRNPQPKGTAWISALLNGDQPIHWIEGADWPEVDRLASSDDQTRLLVPEGAACTASWPGALTLGYDLWRNEQSLGQAFQHVWIDSGTGTAAAALAVGLGLLGRFPTIHIMLAAGTEPEFHDTLQHCLGFIQENMAGVDTASIQSGIQVQFHIPPTARAFGSVNASVEAFCKRFVSETGVLIDPIYTAKLMMAIEVWGQKRNEKEPTVVIHGGGLAALTGFSDSWTVGWL